MGSQKNRTGLSNSTTTTTTKQSPTFLAPETSFMEDNFSPAGGKGLFRVTQVHYIYYATADLKGGGAQALIRTMRSNCQYRWNCACSLTAMQPGLNRPWTSIDPWPGGWDPCRKANEHGLILHRISYQHVLGFPTLSIVFSFTLRPSGRVLSLSPYLTEINVSLIF